MKNSSVHVYNPYPRKNWNHIGGNKKTREREKYEMWKGAVAQMKNISARVYNP